MRSEEASGAAQLIGLAAEGATHLAQGTHEAVAGHVLSLLTKVAGPIVEPIAMAHNGMTKGVYGAVHVGLAGAARLGAGIAAARVTGDDSVTDTAAGAHTMGIVNGFHGDHLRHIGNPLAFGMSVRESGHDVDTTREALAAAYPEATGHLTVFVHGLMETDRSWGYRAAIDHDDPNITLGRRLHAELGYTPLLIRYNTGFRISRNGRLLADILDNVVANWPVTVTELVLIGHSMGGLVIRSALAHEGGRDQVRWTDLTRATITLGTPHFGAPLARGAGTIAHVAAKVPQTMWLSSFIRSRSGGIRDLAHGNLVEADWAGHMADDPTNRRTEVTLPEHLEHFYVVASLVPDFLQGHLPHVIGDGLVPLHSAAEGGSLDAEHIAVVPGLHHLHLLNDPLVHSQVLAWLSRETTMPHSA